MNTADRIAINQANSLHSTGPRTLEGKQRAAMNALKHGLTGQRLILQPEEHEVYRRLSKSLDAELRPRTTMERQLVQKIIDTQLRLNRVAVLDNNMLNFGLLENLADAAHKAAGDGGANNDNDTEIAHAQMLSFIAQQLTFEKLSRYEGRLSRQLIAYTKELERLQTVRRQNEQALLEQRVLEGRGSLQSRRVSTLRPIAQTAGKGQDLSPQNPTAHASPWSSASFGTAAESAPESARQPDLPGAA